LIDINTKEIDFSYLSHLCNQDSNRDWKKTRNLIESVERIPFVSNSYIFNADMGVSISTPLSLPRNVGTPIWDIEHIMDDPSIKQYSLDHLRTNQQRRSTPHKETCGIEPGLGATDTAD
jgi:hypothetical protein